MAASRAALKVERGSFWTDGVKLWEVSWATDRDVFVEDCAHDSDDLTAPPVAVPLTDFGGRLRRVAG